MRIIKKKDVVALEARKAEQKQALAKAQSDQAEFPNVSKGLLSMVIFLANCLEKQDKLEALNVLQGSDARFLASLIKAARSQGLTGDARPAASLRYHEAFVTKTQRAVNPENISGNRHGGGAKWGVTRIQKMDQKEPQTQALMRVHEKIMKRLDKLGT